VETDTDYECYLLGCRSAGLEPMELWRFRLLQEAFLRYSVEKEQKPGYIRISNFVLERLAALVAEGYRIAAGGSAEGEGPGAAACGVREPRVPLEPVLTGCATCPLPLPDPPDLSFWRV
jgi:hypothetical protein